MSAGSCESGFSTLKNSVEKIQLSNIWKVLGMPIYGQLSQLSLKQNIISTL